MSDGRVLEGLTTMEEEGTAWYADGAPGTQPVLQEGPSDMHLKDEAPLEGSLDTHTPMDAADSNALTAINVEAHVTTGQQAEGQQGTLLPLEEVDGFFTSLDSSGREHRPRYYGHTHNPNPTHALQQYPHNAHGEYPLQWLLESWPHVALVHLSHKSSTPGHLYPVLGRIR